jgi:hypothetical protein
MLLPGSVFASSGTRCHQPRCGGTSNLTFPTMPTLRPKLHAQPGFFVTATHTLASGATYNVFDKYPDAQTGKVIEWGVPYWKAKDKKDKAITVFAFAAYEDNVYNYHVDFIKGLGSKSEKIVKRVISTCTQVSP